MAQEFQGKPAASGATAIDEADREKEVTCWDKIDEASWELFPRQRSTGMDRVFYPSSNAAGPRTFQEQK